MLVGRPDLLKNNLNELSNESLESLVTTCKEDYLSNEDLKSGLMNCDTIMKSRANIIVDSECHYFSKYNIFYQCLRYGRFSYKHDISPYPIPSLTEDSLQDWSYHNKINEPLNYKFGSNKKLEYGIYVPNDFIEKKINYTARDIAYYTVGLSLHFDECLQTDVSMIKMRDFINRFSKAPRLRFISIFITNECFESDMVDVRLRSLLSLFSIHVKFLNFHVNSRNDYNSLLYCASEELSHIEGLYLHTDNYYDDITFSYHIVKRFKKLRLLSVIGFMRCYEFISKIHKLQHLECLYIPLVVAPHICAICQSEFPKSKWYGAPIKKDNIGGIGLGIFVSSVKCIIGYTKNGYSIDCGILCIRNLAHLDRYFVKVCEKTDYEKNTDVKWCDKCMIAL
uniref:TIR domain-containing protein n=1 Tax=Strongyloides venezuelensis TaxID=75913 RepID=A0A0K0F124_STRVS